MSERGRPGGDWSSASESLFEAARADHDASDVDRARVRRALARRLAAEAAQATTQATTFAEGARTVARKGGLGGNLVLLSLGAAAVISGTLVFMNANGSRSERPHNAQVSRPVQQAAPSSMENDVQDHEPADSASQAPSPAQTQTTGPLAASRSRGSAPARVSGRAARARAEPIESQRESANSSANGAAQVAHGNAQRAATSGATEGSREAPDASEVAASRKTPEQPPSRAASEEPERRGLQRALAAEPSADRAELALVGKIHAAMRKGDPASALELCAEHERRWPNGTFVQEREGVRAIASCTLHADDSRARARAFLSAHPGTPIAMSVAAACKAAPPDATRAP